MGTLYTILFSDNFVFSYNSEVASKLEMVCGIGRKTVRSVPFASLAAIMDL